MKKLLLLLSVSLFGISSYAQGTCAAAVNLTGSGTTVVAAINGTYPAAGACAWGDGAAPNAMWYKFTAPSGGIITVTSDIAANPVGLDSRLSIYSGTCAALTCLVGSDDVDYPVNNRSSIQDFVVTAGTTYYFVWDNRWAPIATPNEGVTFDFTYLAATCFVPTGFGFTALPTTTSASIGWDAPVPGTDPIGYQVEYGTQGFTQGTGITVDTTLPEVTMSPLMPSTVYSFYVRSNCGAGDYSAWAGPISFSTVFEAATPYYGTSFEQANLDFVGWTAAPSSNEASDWFLINIPVLAQDGARSVVSLSNQLDTSDARLFSRGVTLTAGQIYTVKYWIRNYLSDEETMGELLGSYQLTMGTTADAASQITILNTEPALSNLEFEERTVVLPAITATGTYFFSFLHDSGLNYLPPGEQGVIMDNFSVSAPLSVGDVLSNKFSVFPNPSSNVISISNTENINVNGIQITDLNGRIVKDVKYVSTPNVAINISDLATGMYMMNITSDQGTAVKKIMKN